MREREKSQKKGLLGVKRRKGTPKIGNEVNQVCSGRVTTPQGQPKRLHRQAKSRRQCEKRDEGKAMLGRKKKEVQGMILEKNEKRGIYSEARS